VPANVDAEFSGDAAGWLIWVRRTAMIPKSSSRSEDIPAEPLLSSMRLSLVRPEP
jgi:hypothetical protein